MSLEYSCRALRSSVGQGHTNARSYELNLRLLNARALYNRGQVVSFLTYCRCRQ